MSKVFLIGAGPGDAGLFTLKGLEYLKKADCVIYDYLVSPQILDYAKEGSEKIYVGKKGGSHTKTQDETNELIVKKAKSGKIVARLKGGDPFIFGRGGEEAEILAKAGIAFEIVPGVTSAISAPAYAGIPLTHRKFNTNVTFITGHEDPLKDESSTNWKNLATNDGTLVFLMGVKNLQENSSKLIENVKSKETPCALISWGTLPKQKTVTGTLDNIFKIAQDDKIKPPAIFVVGEVVNLREALNWFEKKPLFGKRIVITRSRPQASKLKILLENEGAEVIEFPTIQIKPIKNHKLLDEAIERLPTYEYIIFTSTNGVNLFFQRLNEKYDSRFFHNVFVCAIGEATAEELQKHGIKPDFVPKEYMAEALIEFFKDKHIKVKDILIPRAKEAREILPETLRKFGAKVDVVPVYETVTPKIPDEIKENLKNKAFDIITFSSSSTVKNFFEIMGKEFAKEISDKKVVAIGPITKEELGKYGVNYVIIPEKFTIEAMSKIIINSKDQIQMTK